jgi:hypothetical protein
VYYESQTYPPVNRIFEETERIGRFDLVEGSKSARRDERETEMREREKGRNITPYLGRIL